MTYPILIVDDNPAVLTSLNILFSLHGYRCITAQNPNQALAMVQQQDIALAICDMNFRIDTTSGEEGKALFYALRREAPDLPIILLTGWAQVEMAVELMKAGAADYMAKPWDDQKILTCVSNLIELSELSARQHNQHMQLRKAREALANDYDLSGVIYQSEPMQQLLSTAVRVARADVPILITGPNGAGKEKIADIIQRNSSVKTGPFVRVNAGALPLDLMEAEMFGAEPGAYTGLRQTRIGHFEMAHGGTLFLDEIGNLPLTGQAKLLRLLQTGEFQRLGSSQVRRCQVRLICATNSDLPAAISRGEFREDLFYRINVIELALPPLAERKDDIVPLARHFLAGRSISHEALRLLEAWHWPGNVRELQNVIVRATLLAKSDTINAEDFQLTLPDKAKTRPIYEPDEQELRDALNNHATITEAARQLGLSRQALYRRLAKFGIEINKPSGEEF